MISNRWWRGSQHKRHPAEADSNSAALREQARLSTTATRLCLFLRIFLRLHLRLFNVHVYLYVYIYMPTSVHLSYVYAFTYVCIQLKTQKIGRN